ncbi:DEAD/DEAH box helicase [Candidatus Sumerlaeota bacterium]|nr:DEAD/DEAH box helicase [Candidatus Sumerlaeota bacterium]
MSMLFTDFAISPPTLEGIERAGFVTPTEIQQRVIPAALEGRDIIGCAQTGTGKTAAYLIPIIEGLGDMKPARRFHPRALVIVPTRELAQQAIEHFRALADESEVTAAAVFGGVDIGRQEHYFDEGIDVLVATPGRLLEHLERGALKLRDIAYFVIDEADRLLDTGFIADLRRIVDKLPERRQTMLFSATMPPEMERLARAILSEPERIQVGLVAPREKISEIFYPVIESQKAELLKEILSRESSLTKVIVFVRTRARAKELAPVLAAATGLPADELHADLTQPQRNAAVENFRTGKTRLLIATDVAARGLDIEAVSHVINYDVPNMPDDYIHRVGRTARLDREGSALTLVSPKELALSLAIEEAVRHPIRTQRLDGFAYQFPPDSEEPEILRPTESNTVAREFTERKPVQEKREKPFTKGGQLRPKFKDPDDRPPRRAEKKREGKKIMNKRLPHQRKRK